MTKRYIKKLFERIEQNFDMIHACDCEGFCRCWEEFKEIELEMIDHGLNYNFE